MCEESETDATLYEILADNKEITASYEYPGYMLVKSTAAKKLLEAHTPVIIKNDEEINTKNIKSGDQINFVTVQDVKDKKGNVVIEAGTPVSANIEFKKRELIGRSAKITISDFHTKSVDGNYIPLSSVITEEPEDRMVLSIVLSVLVCPLFLLMKGKQARVPANTVKTVYTAFDV